MIPTEEESLNYNCVQKLQTQEVILIPTISQTTTSETLVPRKVRMGAAKKISVNLTQPVTKKSKKAKKKEHAAKAKAEKSGPANGNIKNLF